MDRRRWTQGTLGVALVVVGATGLAGSRSWAAGPGMPAATDTHRVVHATVGPMRDPGRDPETADRTPTGQAAEQMMARCSQMMDEMRGPGDAGADSRRSVG
jgi:hypothetical protein